ncbi:MAG: ABC transporter permease, partial [Planctomycetales bacterium]
RFYPMLYVVGTTISLVCAGLGTLQGARRVLQLQPAESMRPKPPAKGGTVLLERIGWLWRRLDVKWRIAARSVSRNRARSAVGIFAASMGAALMMNGLMMTESVNYLIEFQFEKVLQSDVDLTFKGERGRDALRESSRLPGVDYAEPVLNAAVTFRNGSHKKRGAITGLIPGARLTSPRDQAGRRLRIPQTGLVMGAATAKALRVGPGDFVTVRPVKGLRRERRARIVKVAQGYLGMSCYADLHFLSRLLDEEFAMTGVQLQVRPDPAARARLFHQLKRTPALEGYTARENVIKNLKSTLVDMNNAAITVLIFFAGTIFFGSTLTASLISLAERRRETATLLTLGYEPWTVGGVFLREGLVVNLIGAAAGLPLGYLLTLVMAETYATDLARLPVIAPPRVWLWTLGLGVLFSLASHVFVQRSILRMDLLDALKTQE